MMRYAHQQTANKYACMHVQYCDCCTIVMTVFYYVELSNKVRVRVRARARASTAAMTVFYYVELSSDLSNKAQRLRRLVRQHTTAGNGNGEQPTVQWETVAAVLHRTSRSCMDKWQILRRNSRSNKQIPKMKHKRLSREIEGA